MEEKYYGFPALSARSYASIEMIARSVRRDLGYDPAQPLPGVELFESLDELTIQERGFEVSLNYAVDAFSPYVEAQAEYVNDEILITLSESTYQALREEQPRARFSLTHEIGHAVLHPRELMQLSRLTPQRVAMMRAEAAGMPRYKDAEWQADAFAGSLLMPADGLDELERQGRLDEPTLQGRYLVSAQAAEVRLRIFGQRRTTLLSRSPWR